MPKPTRWVHLSVLPDFKAFLRVQGILPLDMEAGHVGRPGTDFQFFQELLNKGSVSLRFHLHLTAPEISDVAAQPRGLGQPRDEPTESNSLDQALDNHVDSNSHKIRKKYKDA